MKLKFNNLKYRLWPILLFLVLVSNTTTYSQGEEEKVHRRGKLWEILRNDGWIGSRGAWDFLVSYPLGMYPSFANFFHPLGGEGNAENTFSNANFHNFRSGCWIVVKDMLIPGAPPDNKPTATDYEMYSSGLQAATYGVESTREPIVLIQNYIENEEYNPLLPEEMMFAIWNTSTGITVERRSYVWSFPGYRDFIIYDYIFKNTGNIVSTLTYEVIEDFPEQDLNDVYFVFHSGISVSTKSQINFHADLSGIHAGGFGWTSPTFHDFYHIDDDGELVYSTNWDGGYMPTSWDDTALKNPFEWKQKFGEELMSPAAFGWLALYASPTGIQQRDSPKPDVFRIDDHKQGIFGGNDLDLETFHLGNRPKKTFYDFAMTSDLQDILGNNGDRFNFYTFSYGPYDLAHGDSVRFVMAEIAGVMDYREVVAGDPQGHFPDSSIAAIRKNADLARQAVQWGLGGNVNGISLAADVPEPPPSPKVEASNVSYSDQQALAQIMWDDIAENKVITDYSGSIFYDGINDLSGYKIYRSADFQYDTGTEGTVFRGAYWDLIEDIPKSSFSDYWDESSGSYRYDDEMVQFGLKYSYYISAYVSEPRPWTSVNGTLVQDLPELASGDYRATPPVTVSAGPVNNFDIFVAPNPFVFNDQNRSFGINDPYKIEFRKLPESCIIRIYTISGDLVRTLEHNPDQYGNLSGAEPWNQKSDSGLLVAPGLYIYHVESTTQGVDNEFTGKLMIIR